MIVRVWDSFAASEFEKRKKDDEWYGDETKIPFGTQEQVDGALRDAKEEWARKWKKKLPTQGGQQSEQCQSCIATP